MKKILMLLFVVVLFQACEDTATNTPGFQANINDGFFKTQEASAILDSIDSSLTITALSTLEGLMLHTVSSNEQTYNITPNNGNYASFRDAEGNVFSTDTEGSSGKIKITFKDEQNLELTGNFEFMSIRPGLDTTAVYNGYFYRVPYRTSL